MSIDLKLDKMTLAEKLSAMELLWADISRQPQHFTSPDWHQSVLHDRKRLVAEGKMKFQDWNTVIAELKDELH